MASSTPNTPSVPDALIAHDVDCQWCDGNGIAPDGWACRECDGKGYIIVRCIGGGMDDLCTSDPANCGLCRF